MRMGSRCSPTTSVTHRARSRGSSRSRRTRRSRRGDGVAHRALVRHRPPPRRALPRARPVRPQRRQPRAARLAAAPALAVAVPLRRRARRSRRDTTVGPALAELRVAHARDSPLRLVPGRASGEPTLFRKIWDAHVVADGCERPVAALRRSASRARGDEPAGVRGAARTAGRSVRRPDLTRRDDGPQRADDAAGRSRTRLRARNSTRSARTARSSACRLFATGSGREGIVHVIGPELGAHAARA